MALESWNNGAAKSTIGDFAACVTINVFSPAQVTRGKALVNE